MKRFAFFLIWTFLKEKKLLICFEMIKNVLMNFAIFLETIGWIHRVSIYAHWHWSKLTWSNRSRWTNQLISWSNQVLIDFFDPEPLSLNWRQHFYVRYFHKLVCHSAIYKRRDANLENFWPPPPLSQLIIWFHKIISLSLLEF